MIVELPELSDQCSNANGLLLHFGVNFWHKEQMTSVELNPVSSDQVLIISKF